MISRIAGFFLVKSKEPHIDSRFKSKNYIKLFLKII